MRTLLPWLFWSSICAAFLFNLLFLGAELGRRAGRAGRKKTLAALLLFLAVFGLWSAAFRGVSPRGGYDNEHDISLLGMSAFGRNGAASLLHNKEAAPLVMDAAADALSGYSLKAVLQKNRVLMFVSGALLFFCALRAGLGLPAGLLAFILYSFSFLAGLNANTFATTSANLFFLFSAVYSVLALEAGKTGTRGLVWAVSAFFLVWTSRYELAVFPFLAFLFSLASRSGGARAAVTDPRGRRPALALLLAAAALCLAWGAAGIMPAGYNGPTARHALNLLSNLAYHLDARNLALFFPAGAGGAAWALLPALIVSFYGAVRSGRRAVLAWGFLLAACVYTAAVFSTTELYPLQFIRHQLYFSVPFIALFSAACAALWGLRLPAPAAAARWVLLAAACAFYIRANSAAAAALEPEKRTNDVEWGLFLEAAGKWPAGCAVLYPAEDSRGLFLRKYFPSYDPRRGEPPSCLFKYVPPASSDFRLPGVPPRQEYNPYSAVYSGRRDRALAEREFLHSFYTVWGDVETRERLPVRAGFYPADSPADRAWVLNEKGLDLLRELNFSTAEKKFREAVALYPACDVCGLNLAASLLVRGGNKEALALARRRLARAPGEAEGLLARGLEAAAAGDLEAAERNFGGARGFNRSGLFPVMAEVYTWLLPEMKRAGAGSGP